MHTVVGKAENSQAPPAAAAADSKISRIAERIDRKALRISHTLNSYTLVQKNRTCIVEPYDKSYIFRTTLGQLKLPSNFLGFKFFFDKKIHKNIGGEDGIVLDRKPWQSLSALCPGRS